MDNREPILNTPAWKSPWVIGWVASIFVVLGANLVMVYLAVATNPGLVVEDYYERGQHYERSLFKRAARNPGWHMTIDLPDQPSAGQEVPLRFSVVDRAGVPVARDAVTLFAYRPSDASKDFSTPMEQELKGLYEARVSFPLKGVWDLLVSVRDGDAEYNLARRVVVAAAR